MRDGSRYFVLSENAKGNHIFNGLAFNERRNDASMSPWKMRGREGSREGS
jgi:hypothetical protein